MSSGVALVQLRQHVSSCGQKGPHEQALSPAHTWISATGVLRLCSSAMFSATLAAMPA